MSAPEIVTAAEAWVYARLAGSVAVTTAVGSRVYPAYAPAGVADPFIVHDFGGGEPVGPVGPYGPSAWLLLWDVAVWGKGQGRQALRPAMTAALGALVGTDLAGIGPVTWTDPAGNHWSVDSQYVRPLPVPPLPSDLGEGAWTRVAHQMKLTFQLM